MPTPIAETTYVLPIRRTAAVKDDELPAYLAALVKLVPVVVVDGSPPDVFAHHAASWPPAVVHVPVDEDRRGDLNGKVAGVVTGLRRVRTAKAVIADDDVRYDPFALRRLAALLDGADVVRPQNVFNPAPWHAVLDTGRTLIARATGGDWPGTLGVRMDAYARIGGYDGTVLFENLELVRTLRAAGARELVAYDLFVARRPPAARHYLAQRVRQAYDEFARPRAAGGAARGRAAARARDVRVRRCGRVAAFAVGAIALAEIGRARGGARRVFPRADGDARAGLGARAGRDVVVRAGAAARCAAACGTRTARCGSRPTPSGCCAAASRWRTSRDPGRRPLSSASSPRWLNPFASDAARAHSSYHGAARRRARPPARRRAGQPVRARRARRVPRRSASTTRSRAWARSRRCGARRTASARTTGSTTPR